MKINEKITETAIGCLKIRPTVNNIFITLTNTKGNVLVSSHSGLLKFKGSKKRTAYIAGLVIKNVVRKIKKKNFDINGYIVQLYGSLKNWSFKTALKKLYELKLKNIFFLQYIIKHTHNGLRNKKKRRL
jgi:small subunit ribosomal protein S11